jgi:hypothetical protein
VRKSQPKSFLSIPFHRPSYGDVYRVSRLLSSVTAYNLDVISFFFFGVGRQWFDFLRNVQLEHYNLYSSQNVIRMSKWWNAIWAGNAVRMGEVRNACVEFIGKWGWNRLPEKYVYRYEVNIVAYRPVVKQWFCKHRSLLGNVRNIHARNNRSTAFSMRSTPRPFLINDEVNTPLQRGSAWSVPNLYRKQWNCSTGFSSGRRRSKQFSSWRLYVLSLFIVDLWRFKM